MKESRFQSLLIKELKEKFEGCDVLKTDSQYRQGYPDLLILYNDTWASLEVKQTSTSTRRPNQDHYVNLHDKMSFSRFISPENKEEVLNELQQAFRARRPTCLSKPQ